MLFILIFQEVAAEAQVVFFFQKSNYVNIKEGSLIK